MPIAGDYAFVAANDYEGVVAVHIADKANLTIAGFLQDDDLFDGATDVAIAGNYAFVPAYSEDAVTALDISNPNNLTVASHFKDDDLDGAESIDRREPCLCDGLQRGLSNHSEHHRPVQHEHSGHHLGRQT